MIAVRRPARAALCLQALASDPALDGMERVAVCGAEAESQNLAAADPGAVVVVQAGSSPARVAAGLDQARSALIAVLSEEYTPAPSWAVAAVAFPDDADVLAGEVLPSANSHGSRMAAYLWEYLHWAPQGLRRSLDAREARMAPAGAVVYRKSAVDTRLLAATRNELDYHAKMHAAGLRFLLEPRLRLEYAAPRLAEFLRLRAGWSTAWARQRAAESPLPLRLTAGAARFAWPPLALWRFARRAAGAGKWRVQALAALPYALLFACAEGWGEVRGYWGRSG